MGMLFTGSSVVGKGPESGALLIRFTYSEIGDWPPEAATILFLRENYYFRILYPSGRYSPEQGTLKDGLSALAAYERVFAMNKAPEHSDAMDAESVVHDDGDLVDVVQSSAPTEIESIRELMNAAGPHVIQRVPGTFRR